jgi:carbonic anhydrase/acetyltransferase-like protein (isoleucine patch superfamily)
MIIKHLDKTPKIHPTAYIAPSATICGNVIIGKNSCILFGASIIAEGGRIEIGDNCIILENAVIRSSDKHSTVIKNNTLIGPNAHVVGCTLEECVFIATGASIFHGARIGARSEIRINCVVHLRTNVPPDTTIPINWVAVGNPARIFQPHEHEKIWTIQKPLNFPKYVYGVDRPPEGQTNMPEITKRYSRIFIKHKDDEIIQD